MIFSHSESFDSPKSCIFFVIDFLIAIEPVIILFEEQDVHIFGGLYFNKTYSLEYSTFFVSLM